MQEAKAKAKGKSRQVKRYEAELNGLHKMNELKWNEEYGYVDK